jgi:hypothetical protein
MDFAKHPRQHGGGHSEGNGDGAICPTLLHDCALTAFGTALPIPTMISEGNPTIEPAVGSDHHD